MANGSWGAQRMVKMGTVWDRTVEVLNGRTSMIAPIAVLGILLPSVIRDGFVALSTPGTATFALIGGLLTIVALVAMIWAQLAIVAIATDPATDAASARRQASSRLLPAIGVTLLLSIVAVVLALPPIAALAYAGFDFTAAASGRPVATPGVGNAAMFSAFYFLAYLLLALWLCARLVLLNPVILNERLGIGALRRSVRLAKGLTWRIIGVMILFAIVLLVAAGAAQSVTGIIFRLALGADGITTATFLAGIAGTIVTTAFTALAAVFTAQLYVAVREKHVTP
jgi:hypothetical protein